MPHGDFAPVGETRNLCLAGKRREYTSNFRFRSEHSTFEENVNGCRSCDNFRQRCHVKDRTYIGRDRERTCYLITKGQGDCAVIMPVNRDSGTGYFACTNRSPHMVYRDIEETFVKANWLVTLR
jgi:hypothetical protein